MLSCPARRRQTSGVSSLRPRGKDTRARIVSAHSQVASLGHTCRAKRRRKKAPHIRGPLRADAFPPLRALVESDRLVQRVAYALDVLPGDPYDGQSPSPLRAPSSLRVTRPSRPRVLGRRGRKARRAPLSSSRATQPVPILATWTPVRTPETPAPNSPRALRARGRSRSAS
jgi:hypothetical protein